MLRFWSRQLRAPLRDDSGAAAVETAFALPVVIAFLVGTFELGGILMTEMLMEGAIRDASRRGMTGYEEPGVSREDMILDIIDRRTLNMVDIDQAVISQLVYSDFSNIGKPEPVTDDKNGNGTYDPGDGYEDINGNGKWDADMGKAGLGGPGDVVVYTVTYDYSSLTGILSPLFGENGTIRLRASTAIRNEPYGNS